MPSKIGSRIVIVCSACALLLSEMPALAQEDSEAARTATYRLAAQAQFKTAPPFDDRGLDLSGKDLSQGQWQYADAAYSHFRDADLSGANFDSSNLAKSDFNQANLSRASFDNANLSRSDFANARLSETNLTNSNLLGATFRGADLTQARLRGATLSFADLRGATGVTANQLVEARWAQANPPQLDSELAAELKQLGLEVPATTTISSAIRPTPSNQQRADDLLIVDGTASYGRRSDPGCQRRCATEAVPFARLGELIDIDIGMFTVSRSMTNVQRVVSQVKADAAAQLILTRADLEQARATERLGVVLYSQQVPLLHGDASSARSWFKHGIRIVQPAYSRNLPAFHLRKDNKLGGGADEPEVGLTALGRAVIQQLLKQGMIIDVSHCSEATTMDILALSAAPVLANHANAKALTVAMRGPVALGRNKTDKELLAIAARGGVVGVTTVGWMLDRDGDTSTGLDDFLAHIDYMVNLLGVEHVGIASDSGVDGWGAREVHYADANLSSPKRWSILVQSLQQRGYTQADIAGIMGLNFYRFLARNLPE